MGEHLTWRTQSGTPHQPYPDHTAYPNLGGQRRHVERTYPVALSPPPGCTQDRWVWEQHCCIHEVPSLPLPAGKGLWDWPARIHGWRGGVVLIMVPIWIHVFGTVILSRSFNCNTMQWIDVYILEHTDHIISVNSIRCEGRTMWHPRRVHETFTWEKIAVLSSTTASLLLSFAATSVGGTSMMFGS